MRRKKMIALSRRRNISRNVSEMQNRYQSIVPKYPCRITDNAILRVALKFFVLYVVYKINY